MISKEITKNLLKGTPCEDCYAYNAIQHETKKNAEDIIKGFRCKITVTMKDGELSVILPPEKGCTEWEDWNDDF
jgi:hypothetical protein